MQQNIKTLKQALNPAYLKKTLDRVDIELFKKEFISLLDKINDSESEEFHKNLITDFLNSVYYRDNYYINTNGSIDLVIHNGKDAKSPVGVLIEVKKPTNKSEMVSKENLNTKSLQELVLYYLRERKANKNLELRYLIITNINEWFVFDAQDFKKLFYDDSKFANLFEQFHTKRSDDTTTNHFYKEIAAPQIEKVKDMISYTYLNIRDYNKELRNANKEDDKKLIALYKFLSPIHLLKLPFAKGTNELNKEFYAELLHILGLEEVKEKSQKFIVRKPVDKRDNGSIIENAINELDSMIDLSRINNISQYGKTNDERLFNIALDLSITWINRILFLKLLESQIIKYHNKDKKYLFLIPNKFDGYDDLNSLFFQILARKEEDRREGQLKDKFKYVPYLNSSLFEATELESQTLYISNLQNNAKINLYSKSVLKDKSLNNKSLLPLEYLLLFLESYDFSSEGSEDIQEENKPLISASVLGLIFEKINGYKDGSFFTPSFITMFMCRDTLTRTILQKFNNIKGWECQTIKDLHNKISNLEEANQIFDSIKVCDPAVGSGHFLVSSLNEMIYLKSELGILADREGKLLKGYKITIENDELIISDNEFGIFKYIPHNYESQRVQETLFHEKQNIIENCLFGVDINPNSVKICQLRLWIELLKHTYYKSKTNQLETLPNIDINIKCGNSLISRFTLKEDLRKPLKQVGYTIEQYKNAVSCYRNAHNKEEKRELKLLIDKIKNGLTTEIAKNHPLISKLSKKRGELELLKGQGELFDISNKKEKKKKLEQLKKEVSSLMSQIEDIKNNKIFENALEWRFEFPEILNDDGDFSGFDVLIGNPPYVRIQGIRESNPILAEAYNKIFTSATGSYDLYALFTERSLSLIKDQGLINFIMPVKWTNAAFGKGLRTVISANNSISRIINFDSFQVFDASTYTGLQWFEKESENLEYVELREDIKTDLELNDYLTSITKSNFNKIPINTLSEDPWILSRGNIMAIINKLNLHSRRISDVFDKIFQGLATSKDDVYFLYDCVVEDLFITGYSKQIGAKIKIEKGLVKPLLKGEDVHRYETIKTDRVVIFPYKIDGDSATLYSELELETNFPLGYAYLKQCEKVLRGREKGRFNVDGEWFQYGRKQGINSAEKEKLVAPEISKRGNFSYDKKGEFYSTTKIYGYIKKDNIIEDYKFWLGLLN